MAAADTGSYRQPRNRPAAHIVGSRNLALRLFASLEALDRL